jgi:hypothetical protein
MLNVGVKVKEASNACFVQVRHNRINGQTIINIIVIIIVIIINMGLFFGGDNIDGEGSDGWFIKINRLDWSY